MILATFCLLFPPAAAAAPAPATLLKPREKAALGTKSLLFPAAVAATAAAAPASETHRKR